MTEVRPAVSGRRVDVLMIEDDAEYRRLIERWLSRSAAPRFGVSFAQRLDDAWHRIGRCDVILLDLGLPDAAGMDTLVAARELAGDLPIVVLTGMDDDDLGRRTLRAGANAFVPKRIAQPETLHVALRRVLAAHDSSAREVHERSDGNGRLPDRSGRASGAAPSSGESWVEDFWIDPRFGSTPPRAR